MLSSIRPVDKTHWRYYKIEAVHCFRCLSKSLFLFGWYFKIVFVILSAHSFQFPLSCPMKPVIRWIYNSFIIVSFILRSKRLYPSVLLMTSIPAVVSPLSSVLLHIAHDSLSWDNDGLASALWIHILVCLKAEDGLKM